jgi:hypothetical protein
MLPHFTRKPHCSLKLSVDTVIIFILHITGLQFKENSAAEWQSKNSNVSWILNTLHCSLGFVLEGRVLREGAS